MDYDIAGYLPFLDEHVDKFKHTDGSLRDHLVGTYELLTDWGCDKPVCIAGLFHSVYGTSHYDSIAIGESEREMVREKLGPEAERLVWLFCKMDRDSLVSNSVQDDSPVIVDHASGHTIEIARNECAALIHLMVANGLEQLPRRDGQHQYIADFRAQCDAAEEWLMPTTKESFQKYFRQIDAEADTRS